jgi:hypothetical protein
MEGATLTVSTPQTGVSYVNGELLNGDARPSAPPLGYLSLCYDFTPDVSLQGSNTLTISYFPDAVRGFPASALAVYCWDETAREWQRLESAVNEVNSTVTVSVSHLGVFAVSAEPPADTGTPSVTISSPPPGTEVAAPTAVTADASDDQGVASVHFYLNGWPISTDNWGGDGWTAVLDPAHYTAGGKTITAVAEDGVGNQTSAETVVSVAGVMAYPVMTITSPAEAAVLWGDLVAGGDWSGDMPMTLGVFALDDQPLTACPPTDGPWQIIIPIAPEQAGEHVFHASGFDIYGNSAEAARNVVLKVFSDIGLDHWARSFIYAAARANIVQGYPDGTYQPDLAVSRDQMVVYISRALAGGDANVRSGPAQATFPDVPADHWAYRYVEYAAANGIIEGYPDGSYQPGIELDRGQMAAFIARAIATPTGEAGVPDPECTEPPFPDVPCDFWACRYIQFIQAEGVTQGYPDGRYHPEYTVTRDQMSVYIARAFCVPRRIEVRATIQGPPDGSLAADIQIKFYAPGGFATPVHTSTVSLDGSGRETLHLALPYGTYDVWGKVPTHLARRLIGWSVAADGVALLDFGMLLAGDLVNDNVVNQADLDYMQSVWFTGDAIADVNRDGVVNSVDFSIMNGNWGKTGDS